MDPFSCWCSPPQAAWAPLQQCLQKDCIIDHQAKSKSLQQDDALDLWQTELLRLQGFSKDCTGRYRGRIAQVLRNTIFYLYLPSTLNITIQCLPMFFNNIIILKINVSCASLSGDSAKVTALWEHLHQSSHWSSVSRQHLIWSSQRTLRWTTTVISLLTSPYLQWQGFRLPIHVCNVWLVYLFRSATLFCLIWICTRSVAGCLTSNN